MKDKTCRERGCITRISQYNPSDYCWAHEKPDYELFVGTARSLRCKECGRHIPRAERGRTLCRWCRTFYYRFHNVIPHPRQKRARV